MYLMKRERRRWLVKSNKLAMDSWKVSTFLLLSMLTVVLVRKAPHLEEDDD